MRLFLLVFYILFSFTANAQISTHWEFGITRLVMFNQVEDVNNYVKPSFNSQFALNADYQISFYNNLCLGLSAEIINVKQRFKIYIPDNFLTYPDYGFLPSPSLGVSLGRSFEFDNLTVSPNIGYALGVNYFKGFSGETLEPEPPNYVLSYTSESEGYSMISDIKN